LLTSLLLLAPSFIVVVSQQLDLDSFARELDRLDRLAPPPASSPEVDDVDANAQQEVRSWIGSTGSTEEERKQVKERVSALLIFNLLFLQETEGKRRLKDASRRVPLRSKHGR